MKKLISFRALFVFGVLSALLSFCTKENYTALELEKASNSVNPYKISEQDAIASLKSFLKSSSTDDLVSTKSGQVSNKLHSKRIGKIQALRTTQSLQSLISKRMESSIRTKIHEIDPGDPRPDTLIIPDTLIYVVNFDDDGFALLSADSRISSQIIAVVESGSISPEDFNLNEYLQQMYSDTTLTYEDYSWGEDEDGDEIALEDTLSVSSYELMFQQDSSIINRTPHDMIIELVAGYAINEIINSNPHSPGNGIDPGEEWQNPESGQTGQEGGGSSGGGTVTCNWVTVAEVPVMLSTKWFQDYPLNQFTPLKSDGNHKDIGCGPVAVAQILAYHEYPRYFFLNGYYCDWTLMKSIYTTEASKNSLSYDNSAVIVLSHFLEELRKETKRSYWLEWLGESWTTAKKCKKVFKSAGYSNVHRYKNYHEDQTLNMLNNNCPVFIGAMDSRSLEGHFWVIDGYQMQNLVGNNGTVYNSMTLLHCNWGWNGDYDGYFSSGVFNPGNQNFNWWFRMITYDNPNNN